MQKYYEDNSAIYKLVAVTKSYLSTANVHLDAHHPIRHTLEVLIWYHTNISPNIKLFGQEGFLLWQLVDTASPASPNYLYI